MLHLIDLRRLVKEGESDVVEFKKSTADLNGACESLCAFLNGGSAGCVIIGVSNGNIVGQDVTDRTQQEIANHLRDLEPRIKVPLTILPIGKQKKVIILQVDAHWDLIPFTFKSRPFWRVGTTTSLMSREHYVELIREQMYKKDPYEMFTLRDYPLDKIDTQQLSQVVEVGIRLGRLTASARGNLKKTMEKLKLTRNGKPTNAAVILLGKDFFGFPQCGVQMARFKGTKKGEFLDNKQFTGHAFHVFEECMVFIQRHIPLWGKVTNDSPFRKEDYLIPIAALREALVNAICHRSYSEYSGGLFVAIYDDRMEIDNIGSLPRGMTAEDLKTSHVSNPRNKLIADMFYYYGLIEKWGQGTQKIVELCKNSGLPEPEFVVSSHWFKIVIRAEIKTALSSLTSDPSLSLRQQHIHKLIKERDKITLKEILSQHPAIPKRTVQADLGLLKVKKQIDSRGRGRSAHWFAVDSTT